MLDSSVARLAPVPDSPWTANLVFCPGGHLQSHISASMPENSFHLVFSGYGGRDTHVVISLTVQTDTQVSAFTTFNYSVHPCKLWIYPILRCERELQACTGTITVYQQREAVSVHEGNPTQTRTNSFQYRQATESTIHCAVSHVRDW